MVGFYNLLKIVCAVICCFGVIIFGWGLINIFAGNSKGGTFFVWIGIIILAIGGAGVYIFDYKERN